MIEDIKLIGIEDSLIDEILEQLGYDTLLSMACNYKKIKENITILKSFNILNIDELLLNKNEIFFMKTEELKEKLCYLNDSIINLINEDYNVIDSVFN